MHIKLLSKEQLRQFIKENNLKSAQDEQNALKEMFAETLQEMLEAELDYPIFDSRLIGYTAGVR